jgi:hypothetical protein
MKSFKQLRENWTQGRPNESQWVGKRVKSQTLKSIPGKEGVVKHETAKHITVSTSDGDKLWDKDHVTHHIKEGWIQGRPHEGGWTGKIVKHDGGIVKVKSEHGAHVVVHNGLNEYPINKDSVTSFHRKDHLHLAVNNEETISEGDVTEAHHRHRTWKARAKALGATKFKKHEYLEIAHHSNGKDVVGHWDHDENSGHTFWHKHLHGHLKEAKKYDGYNSGKPAHEAAKKLIHRWKKGLRHAEFHPDGSATVHFHSYGHIPHGVVGGGHSVSSVSNVDHGLQELGGMHNHSPDALKSHHQNIGNLHVNVHQAGPHHHSMHIFHTGPVNEDSIHEGKRKKTLGVIRGTTATGQRANPIDTEPKLKLKGKSIAQLRKGGQ